MSAHRVSGGFGAPHHKSPFGGGTICGKRSVALERARSQLAAGIPRLAPWAEMCRPLG